MSLDYHKYVADVAQHDVDMVLPRDTQYKGSWQKRGGNGVFDNLARKWDRIESACADTHYDLMLAFHSDPGPTGLIDDIRDLRRYLLLTEAWLILNGGLEPPPNYPQADRARLQTARQDRPSDSQPGQLVLGSHDRLNFLEAKLKEAMQLAGHAPAKLILNQLMEVSQQRQEHGVLRDMVFNAYTKRGWDARELYPLGSRNNPGVGNDDPHDQATDLKEKRTAQRPRRAAPQMMIPREHERRVRTGQPYSHGRRRPGDAPL